MSKSEPAGRVANPRSLGSNITSLLFLQGANYLVPLVTLPYLVRTLGPENYGRLVFAQALVAYFDLLIDYGFNISATREIAIHRADKDKLGAVFSATFIAKLILLFGGFATFGMLVLAIPTLRSEAPLYIAAFLVVVGNALFPAWLFQGMEAMKYITVLNAGAKIAAAAAIFIFVRDTSAYATAALLQSSGALVAGVLGLIVGQRVFQLRITLPTTHTLKQTFAAGWHIFLSQAATLLLGNTNVFLVGVFKPPAVVGQFAVADKIVKAVVALSIPVSVGIYPRVGALFRQSEAEAVQFLRRVMILAGSAFASVCLALFFGADYAVRAVTGAYDPTISLLIRTMAILPFTVFVANVYGNQILLSIGRERQFMRCIVTAGLFSVAGTVLLVPPLGAFGSAVAVTATQLLILILLISSTQRAGVKLHRAPEARLAELPS